MSRSQILENDTLSRTITSFSLQTKLCPALEICKLNLSENVAMFPSKRFNSPRGEPMSYNSVSDLNMINMDSVVEPIFAKCYPVQWHVPIQKIYEFKRSIAMCASFLGCKPKVFVKSFLVCYQVTAKDADLGQNSAITYNIISSSPSNKFTINSTNGNITTTARLDREINAVYYLNVSAADQSKEQRRSFTIVIVTVVDINDHVPVIQNLPNSTSVSEDVNVGSSVFEVVVVDLDSADNSRLSYSIVSGI